MSYPVFLAYLGKQFLSDSLSFKRMLAWVVCSLTLLLGLMYTGGYLVGSEAMATGFGIYSLNLTAPFCGGMLCIVTDATSGQYEGYNYLGAGTLVLLLIALTTSGRELIGAARKHLPLLLVLLGFTLYATSHRIYLGQDSLLDLPLPKALEAAAGVFRVSGRFFWLAGYCLLFAALTVLLRCRPAGSARTHPGNAR